MSYTFELNNERKDSALTNGRIKESSHIVEVFSDMVQGKELSKYGNLANKATDFIQELNSKASMGDVVAKAELNELRRFAIQPVLMKEIKLLSVFGNYKPLNWEDACEVEVPVFASIDPKIQAAGQDVSFPVIRKERVPISTVTISGGHAVDYRKASVGDMSLENELMEQVRVVIRNKANKYVVETVYNAIKNATGVKYFFEGAGLTKTGVDEVITKVRRWGKPTVAGDYSLIAQFNGFAGYTGVTPNINGIPDAIMQEIHNTGLMGMYNGAVLTEIPNAYDLTAMNKTGDNFDTVLDAGLGFVIPTGSQSPVYTVTRGGLTSCTGLDVTTGTEMTRFDLEVGAMVAPTQEYKLGLLHDKNLDALA